MADEPEKKIEVDDALKDAVTRPDVPKIYANGFSVGLSNADIMIIFQKFGPAPVAIVNLSYTLAKTLAQRLGALVAEFEATIGQDILTTDRIDLAVKHKAAEAASQRKTKTDDVH